MGRIFLIVAMVAFIMTALTGVGTYYLSAARIDDAKRNAIYNQVKGAAQSISTRTALLTTVLQKIAQSPELVDALRQLDKPRARAIVQQLGTYLPGTQAFRLLWPTDTKPDNSAVPHMGYADLDLVKSTFQRAQLALIQGEKGENRHLAMTQGVRVDGQVIAVILASVDFRDLQPHLMAAGSERLYVELTQMENVVFSSGDANLKESSEVTSFNVKNTAWSINYWVAMQFDLSMATLVLSLILIPSFVAAVACYISFRRIEKLLLEDQRVVLKATKDLMMGKVKGNYQVKLKEMSPFISTMVQFKRVLDDEGKGDVSIINQSDIYDVDDSGFFDEPTEAKLIGTEYAGFEIEELGPNSEIGSAISLPSFSADKDEMAVGESTLPSIDSLQDLSAHIDPSDSIFRAYDIRGIVDKTLTQDKVYEIGCAIGSEALDKGIETVIMAKDGRLSSPTLSRSLAEGILSTGTNILDIGTVPTPVLYFVAYHHDCHTGVMLTGSHNQANYNGLKIVMAGETLAEEKIQDLKKRINKQDFHSNTPGTLTKNSMFTNEYIGVITDDVCIARPMKVVVDAGNGVAGELAPILLKTLGCEVIELFCDIDGHFPNHHPDPSKPENLKDLISAVAHYQADVGFAFDGDGDRLGVVDSSGNIIWPDRQIMLFSQSILAKKPGAEIIYDVKCSRHLAEQITKNGGRATIWKTGHSLMKAKVKETAAAFAGEMSGHLFFNDRWFGFDDGLYSAARLIELLSEDSRSSADVFAEIPDSPSTPELSINLAEGENFSIMKQLLINPSFPDGKITDIDGLRVDFNDGFGLVRASNTTPSLVVRFEGDTNEALIRIEDQFRQLILEIKPDISLPF